MKNSWSDDAFHSVCRASCLGVLALWASIACTEADGGNAANVAASGSTSGRVGPVVTGGIGGMPGGNPSTIADGPGPDGSVSANPPLGVGGATGPASGGTNSGAGGSDVVGNGGAGAEGGVVSTGGVGDGGGGVGPAGVGGNGIGGVGDGGANAAGGSNTGGTGMGTTDPVTRTESTFTFRHFPVETNGDDVWDGAMTPAQQPTETTFDTVVLENGYLRVTLLPDYGGRILSIVHKPTGRELLYQNPLGTPYLMYEDIFYYDHLVIMGGIFPSFPEPEHGKYWNQPYEFEVVSESDEAIAVRMSRQDDRDRVEGIPEAYDVGRTDMLVEVDVTLRAGSTALQLDTKLTNTRSSAISEFEYWMVSTLAPGSTPGETAVPLNTRILAAMERVHLFESSWSWFGDAEERVDGEIFTWNNLSYFENWVEQGTAFANPSYQANWWGCVNYDNDVGVLRVSDNVETPGLKLWTFGNVSLDVDITDSNEWLRPTIEMWYGVTPEFWNRGTMAANEVRQWSEHYFPTLGLREVTAASEYGAVSLSASNNGGDTVLDAFATLTLPEQTVQAVLRLDGTVVAEQDVVVSSTEATTVSATVPNDDVSAGSVLEAEFLQGGNSLLRGEIALQ